MREPSAILSCSEVVGWDSPSAAAAAAAATAAVPDDDEEAVPLGPAPDVSVRPVPWNAVCLLGG